MSACECKSSHQHTSVLLLSNMSTVWPSICHEAACKTMLAGHKCLPAVTVGIHECLHEWHAWRSSLQFLYRIRTCALTEARDVPINICAAQVFQCKSALHICSLALHICSLALHINTLALHVSKARNVIQDVQKMLATARTVNAVT